MFHNGTQGCAHRPCWTILSSKNIQKMHHHLQLSRDVHHVMGANCMMHEPWHQNCVVVVPSQDGARTIWKLVQWFPHCECKDMIKKKGIVVGQKERPTYDILRRHEVVLATLFE